jgi:hypothetical protein
MKKQLFPFVYCIILAFLSCTKDDFQKDELPAETHIGANTFGCLVNGQLWVAKSSSGSPAMNVDYFSATELNIFASRNNIANVPVNSTLESITFSIKNDSIKTKHFVLDDVLKRRGNFSSDRYNCYYQTTNTSNNKLEITFHDVRERIISGRFELSFPAQGNCAAIAITNGRFDIRY